MEINMNGSENHIKTNLETEAQLTEKEIADVPSAYYYTAEIDERSGAAAIKDDVSKLLAEGNEIEEPGSLAEAIELAAQVHGLKEFPDKIGRDLLTYSSEALQQESKFDSHNKRVEISNANKAEVFLAEKLSTSSPNEIDEAFKSLKEDGTLSKLDTDTFAKLAGLEALSSGNIPVFTALDNHFNFTPEDMACFLHYAAGSSEGPIEGGLPNNVVILWANDRPEMDRTIGTPDYELMQVLKEKFGAVPAMDYGSEHEDKLTELYHKGDLEKLKEYAEENGIKELKVSIFGGGFPQSKYSTNRDLNQHVLSKIDPETMNEETFRRIAEIAADPHDHSQYYDNRYEGALIEDLLNHPERANYKELTEAIKESMEHGAIGQQVSGASTYFNDGFFEMLAEKCPALIVERNDASDICENFERYVELAEKNLASQDDSPKVEETRLASSPAMPLPAI
jgi:hypothetical protein